MTALAPLPRVEVALVADAQRAEEFAHAALAPNTRRAYAADWRDFVAYTTARGVPALPARPEVVAAYLAALADAGRKVSTLTRRLAALRLAHELAGYDSPTEERTVRTTLRGIRRTKGTAPAKKAPATAGTVRQMAEAFPASLRGLRDRALVLMGFAGAFRRSELAGLTVEDVREDERGLRVTLRRSKTDQEGQGRELAVVRGVTVCPVRALRAWQEAAGVTTGPLFRSIAPNGTVTAAPITGQTVARAVKRAARALRLAPGDYAGHSLRRGFLTSAAAQGASARKLAEVSGHRHGPTLEGYIASAGLFVSHAGEGLL